MKLLRNPEIRVKYSVIIFFVLSVKLEKLLTNSSKLVMIRLTQKFVLSVHTII